MQTPEQRESCPIVPVAILPLPTTIRRPQRGRLFHDRSPSVSAEPVVRDALSVSLAQVLQSVPAASGAGLQDTS